MTVTRDYNDNLSVYFLTKREKKKRMYVTNIFIKAEISLNMMHIYN